MSSSSSGKKAFAAAIALLIVGAGSVFAWKFRGAISAAADGRTEEVPIEAVASFPSSAIPVVASDAPPFEWPPLLINIPKAPKRASPEAAAASKPSTSQALPVAPSSTPSETAWCVTSTVAKGDGGVVLNEITWMGSTRSSNDEWLELKNVAGTRVGLGGWQLIDQSGGIKMRFDDGAVIAQAGFLLLTRAGASTSVAADATYAGALPNTGDALTIFDKECRIVDALDASRGWPAGNNATKQTMEREVGGDGWHSSPLPGGSPRAQNFVGTASSTTAAQPADRAHDDVAPPMDHPDDATTTTSVVEPPLATSTDATATIASAHLLIAAVQITGGTGASDNDLVRIYNPAPQPADISGWKLRKRSKTGGESSLKSFADGATVPAHGYFTWANSANGFAAAVNADASSTQTLSANNSAALLDASDTVVDAVAWGSDLVTPYIEGNAYPENPGAGQLLARKTEAGELVDTQDNASDLSITGPS